MYSVSAKYLEAMKRPVQRHRIKGTVNGIPFTEEHILSGSFTITGQCSDATNVQIGQVYTSELKITLLKSLNLSRYSIRGAELIPYFGLHLDDGNYEYIPLGVFTVSSASWAASGVEITAYDNMSKLDRSFSSANLSGEPFELLTLACNSCGLTLGMLPQEFDSLANGKRRLTLLAENDLDTWRDCVSWIAQTCACNVFAGRDGKIVLRAYGEAVADSIDTEHRLTGSTFDDYETRYTGLSLVNMTDQRTVYFSEEADDGLTYNLGSNPFLQSTSESEVETMCREILSALGRIRYVPFKVDMIGNPAYDLMDVLRFEGGFADGEKLSCITKYTFHYNARYSVSGVGTNPALASAKSKSDKDLSGLMAQVSSITSSINRLIYDANTGPLSVAQDEQTLGMVTYYISQKADVEGHFLMKYRASESTRLTLRFYDQGVEELYSPVALDILEGDGSIGVPHAYLNRGVGIHAVYVTAQAASGELHIDTRGIFFSIDAGNFAEPVDDIPMDVRDISMRQLLESNGPDQIWIVGIEDGKMLASYREYWESYTSNPVWTGVYTAGEAIDAAIEFDGKWVLRADSTVFTLETEDQPWYFWILPDGTLLAQHGEDETSRVVLDSDVSKVSACRGYSSIYYPEQDQGLVVAYIKNGQPYYIQYVYDTLLEAKRWLPPELLLTAEEVLDLRVHRLNDYRLGFELTTDTRNIWAYTKRTYVAQAGPKEQGNACLSEKTMFLYAPDGTDLSMEYDTGITEDARTLYIYISRPIRYFYSWRDVLAFDGQSITNDMVDGVEFENAENSAVVTIHLNSAPKNLIATIVVNPADSPALQAVIPGCGHVQAPMAALTYDTTAYRYLAIAGEQAGVRNTLSGIAYLTYSEREMDLGAETASVRNPSPNISYTALGIIRHSLRAETAVVQNSAAGISYAQVEPSPI